MDKRIRRTVTYLLRCPRSTVPEAMRACKFSDQESKDAGKQMAVRRALEKANSAKREAPPPPHVVEALTVGMTTMSLMTSTAVTRGDSTT